MTDQPNEPAGELEELRRRVAELEAELSARDAFIMAAAHELRNPISPLVLHVQRLLGAARNAEDGRVAASWLTDQLELFGRRLTRFLGALNRILDVSQIQGGRIELVIEEVELNDVVREVVGSFEREIVASRSTLELQLDGAMSGTWDRLRVEQIVANLVSNAIRYGAGKPIVVAVGGDDTSAQLVVRDRGIGIREEDQVRIFNRYERAGTAPRSGFGVGLWVVRELCHALGGDVSVSSRPGEGSTFTVTLPRVKVGRAE